MLGFRLVLCYDVAPKLEAKLHVLMARSRHHSSCAERNSLLVLRTGTSLLNLFRDVRARSSPGKNLLHFQKKISRMMEKIARTKLRNAKSRIHVTAITGTSTYNMNWHCSSMNAGHFGIKDSCLVDIHSLMFSNLNLNVLLCINRHFWIAICFTG